MTNTQTHQQTDLIPHQPNRKFLIYILQSNGNPAYFAYTHSGRNSFATYESGAKLFSTQAQAKKKLQQLIKQGYSQPTIMTATEDSSNYTGTQIYYRRNQA